MSTPLPPSLSSPLSSCSLCGDSAFQTKQEAIPTMAEMPITAAELNSGNRGEPVSEDEEQGDDDESPAAFPAAPSTAEDGEVMRRTLVVGVIA